MDKAISADVKYPFEQEGHYFTSKRRQKDGTYKWELWSIDDEGQPMTCEAICRKRSNLQSAIKDFMTNVIQ